MWLRIWVCLAVLFVASLSAVSVQDAFAQDDACLGMPLTDRGTCDIARIPDMSLSPLVESSKNSDVYLVENTLSRSGSIGSVWVYFAYTAAGRVELQRGANLDVLPYYSKVRHTFDCSGRKYMVAQVVVYKRGGGVAKSHGAFAWESVVPGSVADRLRGIVCGGK